MHSLFRLDMIFLQFVVELLEGFEILDGDPHFFNLLSEHEITLGKLNEHLLGTERIVQLDFEILDLDFSISELDQSGFVLS